MSGEAAINASLSNKSQKSGNHLSPIPIARTTSLSINDATRSNIYTLPKPTFNARVVAATALYTAFQYLDHWPVPLIKAYAEDCFGPRIWVDNIQCSQLVENLALTHCEESGIHANLATGDSVLGVAAKIAAAYSEIDKLEQEVHESPSKPSSRRESLGSTGSTIHCSSMLGKRALQRQESSKSAGSFDSGSSSHHISKKPRKQEMNQSSDENDVKQCDSDLSSLDLGQGGDQFTISGVQESNITRTDDNEVKTEAFVSSSSLNENEKPKTEISSDADEKERTNVVPYCGDVNLSRLSYPHTQENLDLSRVRHRYFGMNLECAQSIIVTCLSERIDIKSKQNSGLLFNLPAFATLPGVRYLIAENLEKWLQSPALAGLARNLFSCTVNHMPCIDPPHRDDLRAIESIIQMKLKANQVSGV
jgi:integrator complex subunit 1